MEGTEFYQTASSYCPQLIGAEKRQYSDNNNGGSNAPAAGDHFVVEEFLNFSNDDDAPVLALDGESSTTVTAVGSCNSSSFSGCGGEPSFVPDANNFSGDLCVPYDDLAELEWLSNIVEESFSSEDLQRLQLISGITARSSADESAANSYSSASGAAAAPVPAKARSKRSRAPPCNWTSRLLLLSSSSSNHHNAAGNFSPETTTSDDSSSDAVVSAQAHPHPPPPPPPATTAAGGKKPSKSGMKKKEKEAGAAEGGSAGGGKGRRCLHCATDKTPQWRTGPMGPKTLCNACGVRYKSGRLVPEYRPAASPTFMLTKHSNSHRKVLELRRQKDFMRVHQQQQHQQFVHHHHHHHNGGMVFDHHVPPQGSMIGEDYLIHHHHQHQHVGPDYRQII